MRYGKNSEFICKDRTGCKRAGWEHSSALGIPASSAINMFYKQIILQRGLPFEVKMPAVRPLDASVLTDAQMDAELEKGYADMQAGRTKSVKSAFADIRKDYGLWCLMCRFPAGWQGLKGHLWIYRIWAFSTWKCSWTVGSAGECNKQAWQYAGEVP